MIATHAVETPASPDAVWRVLVDGRSWGEWDPAIAWMWVDERLDPGAYLTIKPKRGRQTAYVIEDVVRARRFAIRLQFGPAARLQLVWTLEPIANGTRITQSIATAGFAAGWLVEKRAARLAEAAPIVLRSLADRAQKNAAPEGTA